MQHKVRSRPAELEVLFPQVPREVLVKEDLLRHRHALTEQPHPGPEGLGLRPRAIDISYRDIGGYRSEICGNGYKAQGPGGSYEWDYYFVKLPEKKAREAAPTRA